MDEAARVPELSVVVLDDYEALSRAAADIVQGVVAENGSARVVVAMGETPVGPYRELARRRNAGAFDTSRLFVYQLDEFAGVDPEDPRSLHAWALNSFVTPLGISPDRFVRLPTDSPEIEQACAAYDREVEESGGYDLTVLGIGMNGHLGFNEPPSDASAPTREVELSEASILSSASNWGGRDKVPSRAITVGMSLLLRARRTLLLASGPHKREIVSIALRGPVTPDVPASYLQEGGGEVTVLLDREAWDDGWPPRAAIGTEAEV